MDEKLRKKIKNFKATNTNSSISVEFNQLSSSLDRVTAIVSIDNTQVSKYEYVFNSSDLEDKYDSIVDKTVSLALDLTGFSESDVIPLEKKSKQTPVKEKTQSQPEDLKELSKKVVEKIDKIASLKKGSQEKLSEEDLVSEASETLFNDDDVQDADTQQDSSDEINEYPDDDDLIDSEEAIESEEQPESLSSQSIMDSINDNPNSTAQFYHFPKGNLTDMLSGEIKEAFDYVTNYRSYAGMTLAEVYEKNPEIIRWFSIPNQRKEQIWPNETKYCKIITQWKERYGF